MTLSNANIVRSSLSPLPTDNPAHPTPSPVSDVDIQTNPHDAMHNSNEENDHVAVERYSECTEELGFQETNDMMGTDLKEEPLEQTVTSGKLSFVAEPSVECQSTPMDTSTTRPVKPKLVTADIKAEEGVEPTGLSSSKFQNDSFMLPVGDAYVHGRGSLPPPGKPTSFTFITAVGESHTKKRPVSEDPSLPKSTEPRIHSAEWMRSVSFFNDSKRRKLATPILDDNEDSPSLKSVDQPADESSRVAAITEQGIEVIDVETFEQDRNDRLAREAQEKQAEEDAQAAMLIYEAEEMRRQELQVLTNHFLSTFQKVGISTDDTVNPQEAKYAAATSEGLASVLLFVQKVQNREKEDVAMLRVDNDILRGELQKSKETEARLAEEMEKLIDSRSQKLWKTKMKAEREKMEGDLSRLEEKLDLLRAPDVTLEEMGTKIDGLEKKFADMKAEAEKFKATCEAEKRLLSNARKELSRDFRTRKGEIERIDGDIQAVEINLEGLSHRIRDLEASSDQVQHPSRNNSAALELSEILDDIVQIRKELEEKDERLDNVQNDIVVFRNHVTEHFFDKDCLHTQAKMNRTFFYGISDLKEHVSGLQKQRVASVAEMRSISRPENSHLIVSGQKADSHERPVVSLDSRLVANNDDSPRENRSEAKAATNASPEGIHDSILHQNMNANGVITTFPLHADALVQIDNQLKRLNSKQTALDADMEGLHEQVYAQSTLIAESQEQQSTASKTDIENRIRTLVDPIRNDLGSVVEDLRLLANKVETMQTEFRERDGSFDAELAKERIDRVRGDLAESLTRETAISVCGRFLNGLLDFTRNISKKSMTDLGQLARQEDKHCNVSGTTHSIKILSSHDRYRQISGNCCSKFPENYRYP